MVGKEGHFPLKKENQNFHYQKMLDANLLIKLYIITKHTFVVSKGKPLSFALVSMVTRGAKKVQFSLK